MRQSGIRWFKRPSTAAPKNLVRRAGRVAKLMYIMLVRINASPHQVAAGFALGVVLGILPTFGFGGLAAVALSFILRINKAATVVGAMIMNPITTVPFWTASAVMGGLITGADWRVILKAARSGEIFRSVSYSTYVYAVGNLTLALSLAVLSYGFTRFAVRRWQVTREKRRKLKKQIGIKHK